MARMWRNLILDTIGVGDAFRAISLQVNDEFDANFPVKPHQTKRKTALFANSRRSRLVTHAGAMSAQVNDCGEASPIG